MTAIDQERGTPLRLVSSDLSSEKNLVAGLLRREPAATALAWRQFSPLVFRILRRSLGPDFEVDDLAQEVFVILFDKIGKLREDATIKSFLTGITIRITRKELSRRWTRRWLLLSPTGWLEETEDKGVDRDARDALRKFYRLLDQFDSESRTAFVLRHVEGMELEEIANALGISLATTKRRLTNMEPRLSALIKNEPSLVPYVTDHDWKLKGSREP